MSCSVEMEIRDRILCRPNGESYAGNLMRFRDDDVLTLEVGKVQMYKAVLSGYTVLVYVSATGKSVMVPAGRIEFVPLKVNKTIIFKSEYGEAFRDSLGYSVNGCIASMALQLTMELEKMQERVSIADQAEARRAGVGFNG